MPEASNPTAVRDGNTSATADEEAAALPTPQPSTKRKKATSSSTLTQYTLRSPPWTYLHLSVQTTPSKPINPSSPAALDAITARTFLTAALQQFLGLTGTAIPIDLLKIEGHDVWIRVPREDGSAVVAALGGWTGRGESGANVGWRVRGWDDWLFKLVGGTGEDLFGDG